MGVSVGAEESKCVAANVGAEVSECDLGVGWVGCGCGCG